MTRPAAPRRPRQLMPPLTHDDLHRMYRDHGPVAPLPHGHGPTCTACGGRWPCDAARLLAVVLDGRPPAPPWPTDPGTAARVGPESYVVNDLTPQETR